jgi:hypothetical protein
MAKALGKLCSHRPPKASLSRSFSGAKLADGTALQLRESDAFGDRRT